MTCIELVNAYVPKKSYVIDNTHNKIYFQETSAQVAAGTYLTAAVPVGNRDIDNICLQVGTVMTTESGTGSTYVCTYDEFTERVTIEQTVAGGSDAFTLLFEGKREKTDPPSHKTNGVYSGKYKTLYKTGSIGQVLGFKRENYTGNTEYTGSYSYNLKVFKYISLFVNKDNGQSALTRVDSINTHIKGAFIVIPLEVANNFAFNRDYNGNDHSERFIMRFATPIGELNQIDIEFRDSDGNLVEFNGHDHMLIFNIHSNTRSTMYTEDRDPTYSKKVVGRSRS